MEASSAVRERTESLMVMDGGIKDREKIFFFLLLK
jgi:hypothetical protein